MNLNRTQVFFACLILILLGAPSLAFSQDAEKEFQKTVAPFFKKHCVACHGPKKKEAAIGLHEFDSRFVEAERIAHWEEILEAIGGGDMPPEDQPQPSDESRSKITSWIQKQLKLAASNSQPRAAVARRLTNVEYENTIRDLLGFELKLQDKLPKDPVKPYRFNNTASIMRLGPEQIDRYLECARLAMASAIVDPEKPEVHKTRREWKPLGNDRGLGLDEIGVWGNRRGAPGQGMQLRSFPTKGEYRIRISASAILPKGVTELPLRLVMGYGGLSENQSTFQIEPVGTVRLSNRPDEPKVFEFRGRIENHPVRPPRGHRGRTIPETMAITPQNLWDDGTLNDDRNFGRTRNISMPRAVVHWIEFESPIVDEWPPQHHRQILFESPLREKDPDGYAREVIKRFMDRAYRRPATRAEVDRFVKIHQIISREVKSLEASMRETLSLVLVSPQFLCHTVANDSTPSQYELASRLSYFLWGSMPDAELLKLAEQGKLNQSDVIREQVERLLADNRSRNFVDNFTRQWLSLEKMKTVPINQDLYPRFLYYVPRGERAGTEEPYRPTIRDYMIEETIGFVGELIKQNKSVLSIVDSDFAFLNQPLAAHYGVKGVEGIHFRAVPIKPKHHLGGLLTHGSVLIGNGTGTAPHPIYRAVFLREAILGDEVEPPPAEVPALSDSAGDSAETALSIKELLVKHRQTESCNSCHARLDPWGIPFEKYNAIGKFQPAVPKEGTRVQPYNSSRFKNWDGYQEYLASINTQKIDATAKLPGGDTVDGMDSLKKHLLKNRSEDVAENVLRRLLTFGIGRQLDYRDRFEIERMLQDIRKKNYGFRDMITIICQSSTFRETAASSNGNVQKAKSK